MAVPRTKKQKGGGRVYTQRDWDHLRYEMAKKIFPNFIALTLMGVIDELDCNHMKNFHLTTGEKERLVRGIADRIEHYCKLFRDGALDPFETRECFEKQTGMDFSKIWI